MEFTCFFKFGTNQLMEIAVNGEFDAIKVVRSTPIINGYFVHYKAADGCGTNKWFEESDLVMLEAAEAPGQPIYGIAELLKGAIDQ